MVEQPDAVGGAQFEHDGAGGLVVEPQHPARRRHRRRVRRVVALLGREAGREVEGARQHADEVLAQQRRLGQAAEPRRDREAVHRDAVVLDEHRRVDLQGVQREHAGRAAEQPGAVRGGDRHRHRRQLVGRVDGHLRVPRRGDGLGEGEPVVRERFRARHGLAGHDDAAAAHQVAHQRGPPRRPDAGSGAERVGLGEGVQQLQQHRVAVEGVDDALHRRRVLGVAALRGVRQQQVVAHHRGEGVDVGRARGRAGVRCGGPAARRPPSGPRRVPCRCRGPARRSAAGRAATRGWSARWPAG